ncbi:IS3 family transposase [Bradyrhizobium tunisiense]|uniref:IS3 family transposase n=1 Tax=Bradyrhizobium tunisiense TaxID=3278709 RepID=UPI0035DBBED5
MSRKAACYDNAARESFFHILKTELVHHRKYQTRAEAQRDIFAFIEGFFIRTRLHSAIRHIAPIEMEPKPPKPIHLPGGNITRPASLHYPLESPQPRNRSSKY